MVGDNLPWRHLLLSCRRPLIWLQYVAEDTPSAPQLWPAEVRVPHVVKMHSNDTLCFYYYVHGVGFTGKGEFWFHEHCMGGEQNVHGPCV